LQHQDSWQNVGNVSTSRSELAAFVFDKSKELEMRYIAPSLPVELSLARDRANDEVGEGVQSPASVSSPDKDLRVLFGESKKFK
jgi:hypothetical protein